MSYPFVAAGAPDYGLRKGPALGFLVHMAEGGGTVAFLAGDPARGVSVHYVIEYSGRVVQMLREDRASGSVNPNDIRKTDDPDGFFGRSAAVAVLGDRWADDPNSAVISLEIEGFAAAGPKPVQAAALAALFADVAGRHPGIRALGHRDFADYKACPGRLIDWASIGGHGTSSQEELMDIVFTSDPVLVDVPAGTAILNPDGSARLTSTAARTGVFSPGRTVSKGGTGLRLINWTSADPVPDLLLAVYGSKVTNVRPLASPAGATPEQIAAAVKAEVNAALDHVAPAVTAVTTAISEARPR